MAITYTLKEAAEILGCDIDTLKYDIKEKRLQAERKKISGKRFEYIIPQEYLIDYAREEGIELDFEDSEQNQNVKPDKPKKTLPEQIPEEYDELKKLYEYAKKLYDKTSRELELANQDFNEQAREYDQLLMDHETLEEDKSKQDELIAEAEQALLDMVEQYKELAENTFDKDKNINKLTKEVDELKSNVKATAEMQDLQKRYNELEENYQMVLMEKQRLHLMLQRNDPRIPVDVTINEEIEKLQNELKEKTKQLSSVRDIHKEIEKLQKELKKSKEQTISLEQQLDTARKSVVSEDEIQKNRKLQKKHQKLLIETEKLKEEVEKSKDYVQILEKQISMYKKGETEALVSSAMTGQPFSGNFSTYETLRLVRFLFDARSTGIVAFTFNDTKGELHIKEGNLVYASFNKWEGDLALARFLYLKDGNFNFTPDNNVKEANVSYSSRELLDDFMKNRTEKIDKLLEISESLISPDKFLKIERNWLEADVSIKLTKYHVKILSLISQGKETIKKISISLNSSQLKVADSVYYLIKAGLIAIKT